MVALIAFCLSGGATLANTRQLWKEYCAAKQEIDNLKTGLTNALGRIETLEKQSRELSTMASRLREDRQHGPQRGGAQSWQNFVAPIRRQAEEAPIANRTAGE
jgi:chromosome segregation ATPase